jgi:hypothetical protein
VSDATKPGDPADRATDAKADGAFQGSHRAGYGDRLARVEDWLRKHPDATLASGEGWVLLQKIDRLRAELLREHMRLAACGVVAMANTPDTAAKARNILPEYHSGSCDQVARVVDENMKLHAAIDRVRALHRPTLEGAHCVVCHSSDSSDWDFYPCPTLRALEGVVV